MRLLHRADRRGRLAQVDVAALVGDVVLGPQPPDEAQPFEHARHPVGDLQPEGLEFLFAVADADAEDDAALGHDVEAGDLLGGLHRVQERQQGDSEHQIHRAGFGVVLARSSGRFWIAI